MLDSPYNHNEDAKNQRAALRKLVMQAYTALGLLCIGLLLLLAVTWPTKAHAETVPPVYYAEHNGVRLRLLPSECVDPTSIMLIATAPPQFQRGWKSSSSDWRQPDGSWATWSGCWLLVPKEVAGAEDDVFVLVFADGATAQVLKRDLLNKKPST